MRNQGERRFLFNVLFDSQQHDVTSALLSGGIFGAQALCFVR
jgi:hypothetical protein